jgi:hypothetical protein
MKDLEYHKDVIVHESYQGNGFCYRRFNMNMRKNEQLAYTGYFGAWTDDTRYWERKMISNTQLHRKALKLHSVSWLSVYTIIDKVRFNTQSPYYDVFMYQGCTNRCGISESTPVKIEIKFENQNNSFIEVSSIEAFNEETKEFMK